MSHAKTSTPHYNKPEDAKRYPEVTPVAPPAHEVKKGDSRIDGPYLDDIRASEADARRQARMNPPKKKVAKKTTVKKTAAKKAVTKKAVTKKAKAKA